jgi:hypothetical protein
LCYAPGGFGFDDDRSFVFRSAADDQVAGIGLRLDDPGANATRFSATAFMRSFAASMDDGGALLSSSLFDPDTIQRTSRTVMTAAVR